jgi:predicted MFS family arabinose efflux permease
MTLSRNAAFYLQLSIIVAFLAGSSAPTPLYPIYQAAWGFSAVAVTLVFGIYALAVLASLLTVGSLSDHVGRRPVLIVAALMQVGAMLVFATAHGLGALLAARVIQGLATGGAAAAVGAGLLDLDRSRGTVANAVGPMLGTASGSLLSGILVQLLPAPTQLIYLVLAVVFAAQAIGVAVMPETATPRPGALASLRPQFRLPPQARDAMLLATPALIAAWALGGFFGSLGPALVRRLAGSTSVTLGGLALTVLAFGGATAAFLTLQRSSRSVLTLGNSGLIAGVVAILFAVASSSTVLFFAGTVIAGVGFGAAFQGAIRTVLPLAAPHERAGVLSVIYVVSYLAMGLPAVLGGLRAVHGGGLLGTAREYGFVVIALAALALAGTLAQTRPRNAGVRSVSSSTS